MTGKTRSVGIGIDYGTSNSAAAIYDGVKVSIIELESTSTVMPSATYVDSEYKISTGQNGIDTYIEINTGRTVELSAELLGEGRTTTGQLGDKGLPEEAPNQHIYGQSLVDNGQQGRLFRGIKRLLSSVDKQRIMVFDKPFRLVALITPLLLRIRASITTSLQKTGINPIVDHACIGHPVNFEGNAMRRNDSALKLLSESYEYAGFLEKSYCPEPIAATLSYLHANPETLSKTLLAVDFGGGTLDFCIIQQRSHSFEVIATHGVGVGGDHIDQLLFKELLFPLLGRGERWRRAGAYREIDTLFPFEEYEDLLLNWTVSYMLNQNKFTAPLMQRIQVGDEASKKFRRLYDLIKGNNSYTIFQAIKNLKAHLSTEDTAVLDVPEIDVEIIVERTRFEEIIKPLLIEFESAIDYLLADAKIKAEDIDIVLRTGGSSLIPAVKNKLTERFGNKVIEHDPFTSVASGLAIAEYNGFNVPAFNNNQISQASRWT
ncbi:MAG: hypothetical protein CL926_08495 [Deltaproteobacteria bacterium]|nr:hypothetical protein [Deltaproteobacteria bacterium]